MYQAYDGFACYELALAIPTLELLVVNSHLGVLDGPELIRRVRLERPQIAVLHVGSDRDGRIPPEVPNLAEPFSVDQLLEAVDRLLPPGGNTHTLQDA